MFIYVLLYTFIGHDMVHAFDFKYTICQCGSVNRQRSDGPISLCAMSLTYLCDTSSTCCAVAAQMTVL